MAVCPALSRDPSSEASGILSGSHSSQAYPSDSRLTWPACDSSSRVSFWPSLLSNIHSLRRARPLFSVSLVQLRLCSSVGDTLRSAKKHPAMVALVPSEQRVTVRHASLCRYSVLVVFCFTFCPANFHICLANVVFINCTILKITCSYWVLNLKNKFQSSVNMVIVTSFKNPFGLQFKKKLAIRLPGFHV